MIARRTNKGKLIRNFYIFDDNLYIKLISIASWLN